jgi:hypothetical protein
MRYGRDKQGRVYREVGSSDSSGCGCLLGGILVLGVLVGLVVYGFFGATWVGIHVYAYFNNNNEPGAYEMPADYFYGCAGLLFVFAVGTALTTIIALFSRSGGAVRAAVVLFILGVGAFIATVITYNTYIR